MWGQGDLSIKKFEDDKIKYVEKSVMKTERMLPLVVNQFGCHHRCLSFLSSGYYRYFYSLVTWTEFPQVYKTLEITWRHGCSLFFFFFFLCQPSLCFKICRYLRGGTEKFFGVRSTSQNLTSDQKYETSDFFFFFFGAEGLLSWFEHFSTTFILSLFWHKATLMGLLERIKRTLLDLLSENSFLIILLPK